MLTEKPLDDLISVAQAGPTDNTEAMAEILRRFDGSVQAIAKATATEWNLRQDAAQGARLGLVKAVRAHRAGTKGFPSYAHIYMRSEARRAVAAMTSVEIVRDPEVLQEPPAPNRPGVLRHRGSSAAEPVPFRIETVIQVLPVEQQAVAGARYVNDLAMAEIARRMGISIPAVSQRLKTIHNALRPIVAEAVVA